MQCRLLIPAILLVITTDYTSPQEKSADDKLKEIEDDFWSWRMRDAPEFASAVGDSSYNDILESFKISVYEQRKEDASEFLRKLQEIDKNNLTAARVLDFEILSKHLSTFIEGSAFYKYQVVNPVNFLEGINADPGRFQVFLPFSTVGDFENYLQRLTLLPAQIDDQIELMKLAISLNNTLNNVSVAAVLQQIEDLVSTKDTESPLYVPAFTSKLNASSVLEERRAILRSSALGALTRIKEALGKVRTFLEREYMPATRASWGVHGLPNGTALYQQCLRYHTSTNMTPEEVHELGKNEMKRIQTNMQAALKRLDFNGTSQEFYESIRNDPQFFKNSSDQLLATFEDYIYNRIFPKLPQLFKNIPDYPLRVLPMPYDGPMGTYQSGTPDGKVPGTFYANLRNPADNPTISLMSLTLHETVPGHHLQSIYSIASKLPSYRAFIEDTGYYRMPASFPINTAYVEGWGLYAEFLGEELGMYTDDYMLMGRYSDEIFRACRLVVDTGLHYFKWEREQAIQFMVNNTANSRHAAEVEVDRYITWPGQATAYKIGELKLKELRQKATEALGNRFDIRDFHSLILDNGGMSLDLLERLVNNWITSQLASTPTTAPSSPAPATGGSGHVDVWGVELLLSSVFFCWSVKGFSWHFL